MRAAWHRAPKPDHPRRGVRPVRR